MYSEKNLLQTETLYAYTIDELLIGYWNQKWISWMHYKRTDRGWKKKNVGR